MFKQEDAKKQVADQFEELMKAESEFLKQMEVLRNIPKEWNPQTDDEKSAAGTLLQEIDGRAAFAIRQMLLRYGNLLFL